MNTRINFNTIHFLLCIIVFVSSCTSKSELIGPVIKIQSGQIKGTSNSSGTVISFKGIPYAAPPVGNLRWREPQPPLNWEGIREANHFGASAIQEKQGSRLPWTEEFMVQNDISEDCLFLNIWTPANKPDEKLAVLVFIHGGALVEGSGAVDVYDGEALAKKGIIVVTINYRLDVLGYLAHPELSAESAHHVSGNYGLLDQLAALRWIRDNISAFGGDPSRATIAGQSAGAGSVNALTILPQAKGLFHGAITESGTRYVNSRQRMLSLQEGEELGVEFAKSKGASGIEDLRAMPALALISQDSTQRSIRFGRVIDGYYQPNNFTTVFAEAKQNDTPFINGFNADETSYEGEKGEAFNSLYPANRETEQKAMEKLAGQEQTKLNAHLWMEHRAKTSKTKSYEYFFTQAIPWPEHPEFGAFHTGEIPYVFNNLHKLDRPWTDADTMVADVMSSYWVNFVKNGDPNGQGLPEWLPYDAATQDIMQMGQQIKMLPIVENENRYQFLKGSLTRQVQTK